MSQHAIAEIAQIGSARAEISIFSRIIRRDFRINRSAPRPIGDIASVDPGKRWCDQAVVLEKRNLEGENSLRFLIASFVRKLAEILLRRREGIEQSLTLLRRGPVVTDFMLDRSQTHERSQRDPGGGRSSLNANRSSVRSIVHPENLRRPASPAPAARPSHQPLPRENRSS